MMENRKDVSILSVNQTQVPNFCRTIPKPRLELKFWTNYTRNTISKIFFLQEFSLSQYWSRELVTYDLSHNWIIVAIIDQHEQIARSNVSFAFSVTLETMWSTNRLIIGQHTS
jgi:hypothetical protein